MGAVVTFDYSLWSQRYPEFQAVDSSLVGLYFQEATIYHSNSSTGLVQDAGQQLALLGMVTAHICQLNAPSRGTPVQTGSPQLVGQITDATEGSVSVTAKNDYPPGTVQWWQQTKYGAAWWAATAPYRSMQYRRGRMIRETNPYFGVPIDGGGQ